MRKELIVVFVFLVLSLGFVYAQGGVDPFEHENAALSCLDDRVNGASSLTLEEAVFSMLAGADKTKTEKVIDDFKDPSEECWPAGGCRVKDTAQVILAKRSIGRDMSGAIGWLKSKSGASANLDWFLQITVDNNEESSCDIDDGAGGKSVTVGGDLKLSSIAGGCLSVTPSGYWLDISNTCYDNEFAISCVKSFKTNLLYRKETGGTVFVQQLLMLEVREV